MESPCLTKPCYNSGTCSPISYRDGTYKCTCHPGYLGRLCETAAPECVTYTVLNETGRRYTYRKGPGYSDDSLLQGWYRFKADGYTKMIDRCIPLNRCGGETSGWLKGGHPTLAHGIVIRKVCFRGSSGCCWKTQNIDVRDCGGYYVYKLEGHRFGRKYVYCAT